MLSLDLDKKNDILYIKVKDMGNSFGVEIENGLVVFHDISNRTITGVTIFDFLKKYRDNEIENIKLPIKIDFKNDVYPNLQLTK